ncbi:MULTISPECIES: hypothetical protein [Trichocoleus]|uniref:Uncharacterized protein n=1 Tax=Trichocoleus desertorum GB2-A4 TaxID=2933944 RepID=A0ABV0J5I4_9CYAN|nr:hypothetical protein [Trichocoleus sp. FACHB-46]MBD1863870.1 hypothetical protein [Trichocoleus sp. FACHB-46]
MLLPVIPELTIHRFKFLGAQGDLQDGMRHRSELYRHVASFEIEQHRQAYALGIDLAQHGGKTVLTRSQGSCAVWVSLRSCCGMTK